MGPESGLSNSILVCNEINRAEKDYQLNREALFTKPVIPFPAQNSHINLYGNVTAVQFYVQLFLGLHFKASNR